MKHKTLNLLIYFIIIFSAAIADEWINSENKIIKTYSFNNDHTTYKIFTDSTHYIVSNVFEKIYSKKYSMIISMVIANREVMIGIKYMLLKLIKT